MNLIEIPEAAVGSVLAALIAGVLSFLGLVVTKEQRVSEFRQQWIDSLRSEISELIAHLNLILDFYDNGNGEITEERASSLSLNFIAANTSMMKVRLRMNPKEQLPTKILGILNKAESKFQKNEFDVEEFRDLEKQLLDASQKLLKQEWDRVRRGEPIFIVSKVLAGLAVLGSIISALILYYR